MSDLIEKRDFRTRARKKKKREMDSVIGLSYADESKNAMCLSMNIAKMSDTKIRLLDEGYFDNGFLIKKGAMEKFYNGKNEKVRGWEFNGEEWEQTGVLNLTSDFVGTVNLGHMDFATFPYIIGEWTKEDLSLVDIENDRKGLDVALRLDEESVFVKELKRQPYDIGVSAEFWYSVDDEATEQLSEMLGYYIPVFDEIFIFAYGLVGECGNVNSSGLELKGGTEMAEELKPMEETIETEAEAIEEAMEEATDESVEEPIEASAEEEPVEELNEEELSADEAEEETEETEEEIEEADDEEVEEDEEVESEEDDDYEEIGGYVENLLDEINDLKAENAELKKTNRRLSKKLKEEKSKKEAFVTRYKGLSQKLIEEEEPKPKETKATDYVYGDGIGD